MPEVTNLMAYKVLSLITGLHVGGAEKLLLDLTGALDRNRFEPVVCTLIGGELVPAFERAGIRVHNVGMRHKWDVAAVLRLRRVMLDERPIILHTHLFHADVLGRLIGRLCHVPIIVNTHHMLEAIRHRWLYQLVDRWSARLSDAHAAVSAEVRRGIIRAERLDPSRIAVIPNGVGASEPIGADERRRRRAQLGLSDGAQIVGIVSRLEEPRKGHRILFEAVRRLAGRWPALHCAVVGDGPGRAALEAHVRALGLDDRVTFLGNRHDVPQWLGALDVFALPSLLEGAPMAVLEAMAAGCPIVATNVGGVPELITDGLTGLLIPPGDAASLAHALHELLQDEPLALRLGVAARARFQERFDIRHTARRTEAWYDELLRRRLPNPINVLEVATSLDAGGVTTYLANLIPRFSLSRTGASTDDASVGLQVSLASGAEGFQAPLVSGLRVPYDRVPLVKPVRLCDDLKALWRLCRLIRRRRADIVHTHMSKSDLVAGLAARLCGVRCIVSTAHGPLRMTVGPSASQAFFDWLERLVYRCLHHRVISVSESTTRELLDKRKVTRGQIVTIPNGIDVEPVAGTEGRERLRASLGLSTGQPVIGMVSRLKPPKSPSVLLDSVKRLGASWPDLACLLIGDGPQAVDLARHIQRDQLERSVKLLGHRDDVRSLLGALDLFVLSSDSEGLSMSVLEAMAAGLPVVASRVGGMEELLRHGETGWLVPPGDAAALAEAISTLLRDPGRRHALGEAARREVLARFDPQRQAERTREALFESLIRACRPGRLRAVGASPLERFRRYIHDDGWRSAAERLARRCVGPIYHSADLWFLDRAVEEPVASLPVRVPCAVHRATLDDIDRLASVSFESRAALAQQLASERDVCFMAEQHGRVAAFQWVALGARELLVVPLERTIRLGADEAYLYNCRALRSFRGQGVVPAIEMEVLAWLRARGFRRVATDIRHDNAPSMRTFEKLGFTKRERVIFRRWVRAQVLRCYRSGVHERSPVRTMMIGDLAGQGQWRRGLDVLNGRWFQIRAAKLALSAGRGPLSWVRRMARLVRLLRRTQAQLVHCQTIGALALATLAAPLSGVRCLTVTVTRLEFPGEGVPVLGRWAAWIIRRLLRRAQRVCFQSAALRDEAVARGWVAPGQTVVIREWLRFDFHAGPSSADARRRLQIREAQPVVGTIMPLAHASQPWRFLAFCQQLDRALPQCQFVVAGDGPLFMALHSRAQAMGLADRMRFIRRGYEPTTILRALDVFVEVDRTPATLLASLEAAGLSTSIVSLNGAKERRGASDEPESNGAGPALAQSVAARLRAAEVASWAEPAAPEPSDEVIRSRYAALQYAVVWQDLLAEGVLRTSAEHWRSRDGCPVPC